MSRFVERRSIGIVLLCALGFAACNTETEPIVAKADEKHFFKADELSSFVRAADLIVEGEVRNTAIGRRFGSGEGSLWFRNVTIERSATYKGDAEETMVFEETGWDSEKPMVVNGYEPSEVGDRGIFFLRGWDAPDDAPPYQMMTHAQGRYLFVDGQVDGPDDADPLVRSLERLTPEDLRTKIRQEVRE